MVVLDGASLTIDSLAAVAERQEEVVLAPAARDRMAAAREVVEEALRGEVTVYGLTTAVAERKTVLLDAAARRDRSRILIKGHLMAQGPPAPRAVVRAAMTCLVNGYAKGAAGVRPELAEMLADALNRDLVPNVRSLGSVGQADLGPLADLAEGLLRETGFALADNEGLALVNNNAFATGWAALAELAAERLVGEADISAALALEGFAKCTSPPNANETGSPLPRGPRVVVLGARIVGGVSVVVIVVRRSDRRARPTSPCRSTAPAAVTPPTNSEAIRML